MKSIARTRPIPDRTPALSALMLGLVTWLLWVSLSLAAPLSEFAGDYTGRAEVQNADGSLSPRDMSVQIRETKGGFVVAWTTTTYRAPDRTKEKSYRIEFVPTDRDGVFAAAQEKNVFGHRVQLDPMAGEPYVWARIKDQTMTVYSMFVDDAGGYEMQQFDRTLVEGGLQLNFTRLRNGAAARSVSTFLERQ